MPYIQYKSTPLAPLTRRPISAGVSPRYNATPRHLNKCLQAADIRRAPEPRSLMSGVTNPPISERPFTNQVEEVHTSDSRTSPLGMVIEGSSKGQAHVAAYETIIASLLLEFGSIANAPLGQVEAAYKACHDRTGGEETRERLEESYTLEFSSRRAIESAEKAALAISSRRQQQKGRPLTARDLTHKRMHYVPPPSIYIVHRPPSGKRATSAAGGSRPPQSSPYQAGTVGYALTMANEPIPEAGASVPRRPNQVKSALGPYLRRPIAGQEAQIKATKNEVLNLRRVLNEVQLHLPALSRLQSQKKVSLETEEGQARCLMDIFAIIDEDGSGEIDEQEFTAFGKRIGGETAKVFSKRLFYRIVSPEQRQQGGGIGLEPFLDLLFPNFMRQKRAQELAAEEKRREVTTMPTHWQDTFDARDIEELYTTFKEIDRDGNGSISAEELALYCEGPMALVAPKNGGTAALTRYQRHLKAFDINGDGQIDFKEFAEMQKFYLDSTRGKKGLGGSEVRATIGGIQPPQWLPYFD